MSAPEAFQLSLGPLTGVAFGPDRTEVAISPNSNEAQIYKKNGDSWDLQQTLSEHDKLITAISWAPQTNRIVTCSQDRNAYVWTQTPQGWKPALVLLRINRAATCVKWSPKEDKFAVGSGARSTVLGIDWHPNNVLLAAGTAESKAYVFSAFIKNIDSKPEPTVWGDRLPFGTICGEYSSPSGGWVHDVAFSPSGDVLGFVAHDSSINLVYPSSPGSPPQAFVQIRTPGLPFISLTFTSESSLIAAGHDCQPVVFSGDQSGWIQSSSLDAKSTSGSGKPGGRVVSGSGGAGPGRLNTDAFNMFRTADTRGQSRGAASTGGTTGGIEVGADGMLLTVHQNSITLVEAYEWGSGGTVSKVVTAGKDGRLVIWDVAGKK